ncbi:MAG: tagatose-bisphosphate aldolase [Rhizobiales bacterium]|nr:tagatose-bisphosphate aldolase [Hyphomicrobiales bacterium]
MSKFTTAELRGFQQVCTADGAMVAIACDQRGGMRTLLAADPEAQKAITDADLGKVKSDIVQYLGAHASAVLLDPVCAVPGVVQDGTLPRDVALLIGLDASGYDTDPSGHRLSRLAKGVGARQVRELGGTAGKIMVYLRPDRPQANEHNLEILRHCIEDFAREDMLLVVEFLTYPLEGEDKTTHAAMMPELVEGGVRLSLDCGAKLLKVPFPGTAESCGRIHAMAAGVPWTILSAGVDHSTFLGQVKTAVAAGAAGVIAGRALWKDCISLDRSVTRERLTNLALPRLREIHAVVKEGRQARKSAA